MTKEEAVAKFEENWESASSLSDNLTWAIFPIGDKDLEFQTAQQLLEMFPNLPGILYVKEGTDPAEVIQWAKAVQEHYEEQLKTKLSMAAEESGYQLHLGS